MASNNNGIKWTLGIVIPIFILLMGTLFTISASADAKLDKEKLDKNVYDTQQLAEKEIRDMDREQLEKMDKKLDRLLEKNQ